SCFFFSSRRRHTRSKRDWSSDVCSSDLQVLSASPHLLILVHDFGTGSIVRIIINSVQSLTSRQFLLFSIFIGISHGQTSTDGIVVLRPSLKTIKFQGIQQFFGLII